MVYQQKPIPETNTDIFVLWAEDVTGGAKPRAQMQYLLESFQLYDLWLQAHFRQML